MGNECGRFDPQKPYGPLSLVCINCGGQLESIACHSPEVQAEYHRRQKATAASEALRGKALRKSNNSALRDAEYELDAAATRELSDKARRLRASAALHSRSVRAQLWIRERPCPPRTVHERTAPNADLADAAHSSLSTTCSVLFFRPFCRGGSSLSAH